MSYSDEPTSDPWTTTQSTQPSNSTDEELPSELPTDQVVLSLISSGMAPETAALTLGLPVTQVRALIRVTRNVLPPAERQLQEDIRSLAAQAVRWAARQLQFGPPETKLKIATSLLGHSARLIGAGDGGSSSEMRTQLEQLFMLNRVVPEQTTLVTSDAFIDIATLGDKIVDAEVTEAPPVDIPRPIQPLNPPPIPPWVQEGMNETKPIPPMSAADLTRQRTESAAALKALLESINDQDEVPGTAEVQY